MGRTELDNPALPETLIVTCSLASPAAQRTTSQSASFRALRLSAVKGPFSGSNEMMRWAYPCPRMVVANPPSLAPTSSTQSTRWWWRSFTVRATGSCSGYRTTSNPNRCTKWRSSCFSLIGGSGARHRKCCAPSLPFVRCVAVWCYRRCRSGRWLSELSMQCERAKQVDTMKDMRRSGNCSPLQAPSRMDTQRRRNP